MGKSRGVGIVNFVVQII